MRRRAICLLSIVLAWVSPLAAAEEKEKGFDELVADATARPGLFDTYEKGDHLYLAIPPERFGDEFLLVPRLRRGIGDRGLYANTMYTRLEASVVTLERRGERVFLLEMPHRFTAAPGTPAAVAVERGYSPSVLAAAKVEAERGDGAAVVDVYGWVVGDLVDAESFVRQAISEPGKNRSVSLDAGRSYLEEVKAFPHNLEISSRLTFRPSESPELDSVPDNRFLSLGFRFSLIELPAEPMTPRLADDRLGLLVNARKNYSLTGDPSFFERVADRWRLEPGERVGDLRRPQEPIVYYLDHTIPEAYRPFVKAGIEAWNAAFAEAGFHEAIRAEPLPAGADPADVRYHTVTWTVSMEDFGAFGNEIADPRTGEMLDADVVMDAGFIESFHYEWRGLVAPRAEGAPGDGRPDHRRDGYGLRLAAEAGLGRLALAARGDLAGGPADPRALAFLGELITEVTMHEIGHTIGLDHNFRASSATPLERLHDLEWTAEHGVAASVMDYLPVNLAPLGEPDGEHYMRAPGPYDRWAIAYLYTPDPERAAELARRSADPFHTFGTDVDLYAPGALDPLTHAWDLSSDSLAWGRQRLELVRQLLPRLPELVLTDGARYGDLTDVADLLQGARFAAVAGAVRYVGGQYVHRDHVGDPGGRPPFVPVPRARQLEALALLTEEAFAPASFDLPPEVRRRLGARHWDHWGHPPTYDGRIDPPLHDRTLEGLTRLLAGLTDPHRLARLRDAEAQYGRDEVLTLPELMTKLTAAIWEEAWTPPARPATALRRDLQRAWLDRLAVILLTPPEKTPADARAVARAALVDLGERLGRVSARHEGLDATTLAHLQESAARIERILDAQLAASLP